MTDADAFWAGSAFARRWQPDPGGRPAIDLDDEPLLQRVDALVVGFWRRYGWARFGSGFLVFDPPQSLAAPYAAWRLSPERVPLLRTAWGHLVTMQGERSFLLDPIYGDERELGCDAVTVLDALLVTDAILDDDLLRDIYVAATRRIGRNPGDGECVTFVPALSLGGDRNERNVEIRDLAVTLDLLSQI